LFSLLFYFVMWTVRTYLQFLPHAVKSLQGVTHVVAFLQGVMSPDESRLVQQVRSKG
jgi:hypothetical protein